MSRVFVVFVVENPRHGPPPPPPPPPQLRRMSRARVAARGQTPERPRFAGGMPHVTMFRTS